MARAKRMTTVEAAAKAEALTDAEVAAALVEVAEMIPLVSRGGSAVAVDNAFMWLDALRAVSAAREAQ